MTERQELIPATMWRELSLTRSESRLPRLRGRPIGRFETLLADVEADEKVPHLEHTAVRTAPSQTSRHSTLVSGSHLNIIASSEITAKEAAKPAACRAASGR